MFCQQCGTENEESAKFCIGCGRKIENQPPQPITVVKRESPYQAKPLLIFIGVALIAALYLLPIHRLLYKNGDILTVSTSGLVNACSNPGWNCSPVISIGFYVIWVLGLGLIVFGIFYRKKTEPPVA